MTVWFNPAPDSCDGGKKRILNLFLEDMYRKSFVLNSICWSTLYEPRLELQTNLLSEVWTWPPVHRTRPPRAVSKPKVLIVESQKAVTSVSTLLSLRSHRFCRRRSFKATWARLQTLWVFHLWNASLTVGEKLLTNEKTTATSALLGSQADTHTHTHAAADWVWGGGH